MYECPNFRSEQSDVFVNAGPGSAFRAPGEPLGVFALEQLVDELAEGLGINPLELRDWIRHAGGRGEPAAPGGAADRAERGWAGRGGMLPGRTWDP